MTVNYTTNLSLGQPLTGTESGTWGDDVNNSITSYLDIAISGSLALTSASFTANALTLTNTQGTSSATNIGPTTAQYYVLRLSSLAANVTITAPSVSSSPAISSKTYLVVNADATYSVTVKASGQTGTSIAPGERATVYYNGTDYIKVTSSIVSNLTGVLPVANGGTGVTTSTGSGNNVLSNSPTLVTPLLGTPTSGNFSSGTFTWPTFNQNTTGTAGGLSGTPNISVGAITASSDASISGLTIGKGGGAVSTNTALGAAALATNTSAINNTAVGYQALNKVSTAGNNTAVGYQALNNTTVGGNTAVGSYALASNTTGNGAVAVGTSALAGNTSGSYAVAIGYSALANSNVDYSTAIGTYALTSLTTGTKNTAIGYLALTNQISGSDHTAVGDNALASNTGGTGNTGVGSGALGYVTSGSGSTGIGAYALQYATTGNSNTALGSSACYTAGNLFTGSNNSFIGYLSAPSSYSVSNTVTLGNSSISVLRCAVTTITAISDARDKTNITDIPAGLNLIEKIRPVSFDWNMRDGGKVGIKEFGFIAQELQEAQKLTGITVPNLVSEENPEKLEASSGTLIPVLVKAIQEQQDLITKQQSFITSLTARIEALEAK